MSAGQLQPFMCVRCGFRPLPAGAICRKCASTSTVPVPLHLIGKNPWGLKPWQWGLGAGIAVLAILTIVVALMTAGKPLPSDAAEIATFDAKREDGKVMYGFSLQDEDGEPVAEEGSVALRITWTSKDDSSWIECEQTRTVERTGYKNPTARDDRVFLDSITLEGKCAALLDHPDTQVELTFTARDGKTLTIKRTLR